MNVCLIIPAAGPATRYTSAGGLRHKLDEDLGGRPVLQRAIELFVKHETVGSLVNSIVVAGPHADDELAEFKQKYGDRLGLMGAKIVRGGKTHRYETVGAALAAAPPEATHIAVHDAARPCTPPEVVERIFDLAQEHDAVIPAIELHDTIKRVEVSDQAAKSADPIDAILGVDAGAKPRLKVVKETLPRDGVWMVQTPQVFKADVLRRAYTQKDLASTDDAALVERLGVRVVVGEGDVRNIKITRPVDLVLARAILGVRAPEGRPVHKRF